MLGRQKQLRAQLQRIVDAALFGISLWVAHLLRSKYQIAFFSVFGGTPEIQPFDEYVWLLLIVVPSAPLLLDMQGFYKRPLLASRATTAWHLFKACLISVVAVIFMMFLFREVLARSVIILYGIC